MHKTGIYSYSNAEKCNIVYHFVLKIKNLSEHGVKGGVLTFNQFLAFRKLEMVVFRKRSIINQDVLHL